MTDEIKASTKDAAGEQILQNVVRLQLPSRPIGDVKVLEGRWMARISPIFSS
jgi:hypothetical protein